MSQGILLADILTTVSPTYASEILTPQYGSGLDQLLNFGITIYGIVNGIDCEEYNPATDPIWKELRLHVEGKATINSLQKRVGCCKPRGPLFGMVSRLTNKRD